MVQRGRRIGNALDVARLDYELGRRGITARRLAQAAGIPEQTLSRARSGRPVADRTLRRLADGLLSIPVIEGCELLVLEPETKTASPVSVGEAVSQEVERDASTSPRRRRA